MGMGVFYNGPTDFPIARTTCKLKGSRDKKVMPVGGGLNPT